MSRDDGVHERFTPALDAVGYRVCNTRIEDEALLQLLAGGVTLLITELCVDCFAGDRPARAARKFPDTTRVPIICLSEDQALRDFKWAVEVNADAFLPNDIEPAILVAAVELLIQRATGADESEAEYRIERPRSPAAEVRALTEWVTSCRNRALGKLHCVEERRDGGSSYFSFVYVSCGDRGPRRDADAPTAAPVPPLADASRRPSSRGRLSRVDRVR